MLSSAQSIMLYCSLVMKLFLSNELSSLPLVKLILGSAYEIEKHEKLLRLSKKHKSSQKRLDKLNWKGKYIYYHKE